jgi:hypothetical protein
MSPVTVLRFDLFLDLLGRGWVSLLRLKRLVCLDIMLGFYLALVVVFHVQSWLHKKVRVALPGVASCFGPVSCLTSDV